MNRSFSGSWILNKILFQKYANINFKQVSPKWWHSEDTADYYKNRQQQQQNDQTGSTSVTPKV